MQNAAAQAGEKTHTGVTLTSDLFYPSAALGQEWGVWQHSRVVAVEMEPVGPADCGRAAWLQSLEEFYRGWQSHASWLQDMSDYNPIARLLPKAKPKMLTIALAALRSLNQI
ncbi:MAG: hypothetical protein U0401_11970 [Anaerolineae bacterium]